MSKSIKITKSAHQCLLQNSSVIAYLIILGFDILEWTS